MIGLGFAHDRLGTISATLSSSVFVPPREETERGLISQTAASNRGE